MSANKLVVCQTASGAIELSIDATTETIWATQRQIASLFDVTVQNITIHLKAIYAEGEMDSRTTRKKSLQIRKEGERKVERNKSQFLRAIEDMKLLASGSGSVGSSEFAGLEKYKMVELVLLMLGVNSRSRDSVSIAA